MKDIKGFFEWVIALVGEIINGLKYVVGLGKEIKEEDLEDLGIKDLLK